ncbi:hypothetical protein F2P56_004152 [Juglans regia]|uniref:Reverse transcriptase Ty1/copia-type domain-containing protein n=2 Tax=Juglans regia TaxID=51240 RepID=A0A834D1A0_JUGRE|nr:uncharacterized mitochondrial protein AtMg00810-like [Juglans regia]KAF5477519.1 hypothetical protein F2P56_004152 [Juglans regia]
MYQEFIALQQNQTWSLVPPPPMANILVVAGCFVPKPELMVLSKEDKHDCKIYFLVYVDDNVITSSHSSTINSLISALGRAFLVKDLGDLSFFLGVEVDHTAHGLILFQGQYIKQLLTGSKMLHTKPSNSPMAANLKLSKFDSPDFEDATLYRSIVGGLQYLSLNRPDLSFAVNKVCQFMHTPKASHWTVVKCSLRYLKATINYVLLFKPQTDFSLQAYSDADWGGCPDDRRSTRRFCIYLGHHLISWSSKKQSTVARSSTKAEYKSLASLAAKVIWLQTVLHELGVFLSTAPTLWCDNIGVIYLSMNPIYHSKTKHMDIDFHFVRDRVAANTLQVQFCSSQDQLANLLTKPIVADRFHRLRSSLNVVDTSLASKGCIKLNDSSETLHKHKDGITGGTAIT